MRRITFLALLFCLSFQSCVQQNTLGSNNQGTNASNEQTCSLRGPVELAIDIESPNSGLGQNVTVTITVSSTIDLQDATLVLSSEGGIDLNSETNIPTVTADNPYVFTTNALLNALGDNAIKASFTGNVTDQGSTAGVKLNKYGFVESNRSFFSYGSIESAKRVRLKYMKENDEISNKAFKNQMEELRSIKVMPTVKKKGANAKSATINISGTIRWQDGTGTFHVLPSAEVRIYDQDPLNPDDLLATVTTNSSGYYSDDVDEQFFDDLDIYIRVYARNATNGFYIVPGETSGDPMSFSDTYYVEISGGEVTSDTEISYDIPNTTDCGMAFSLHHALVMSTEYVNTISGSYLLPIIPVEFPGMRTVGAFYCHPLVSDCLGNTFMHIPLLNAYDWDVIHHEYGHYVMDRFNFESNPGGQHIVGQHLSDVHDKSRGVRLAWGEGYPTYFGLSLQREMNAMALNILPIGDLNYDDTRAGLSYSIESNLDNVPFSYESLGEDDELAVQKILWDIYDSNSDNRDDLSLGHVMVWNIISSYKPDPSRDPPGIITLSEAWEAFTINKSAEEIQPYAKIFADFGVSPEPITPVNNHNAISPITFTWDANGDAGDCCPNNLFTVAFYDSSWDLIHESPPIIYTSKPFTPEYTPSPTDWAIITHPDNAPIVHWVVEGSNPTDFSGDPGSFLPTGPYLSPARTLRVSSSSCPMVDTPYSGSEEHCAADGAYTLPTDFSSVELDPSNYTITSHTWSIGNYICDGGVPLTGSNYNPINPSTCEPNTETLYLNVVANMSGPDGVVVPFQFSAGTLELTVYPDLADLTVDDLIIFNDDCSDPSFMITPTCQMYLSGSSSIFPVFSDPTSVYYDFSFLYPIFRKETKTNTINVPIPDNDPTNPGCSEVTIQDSGMVQNVIAALYIKHASVGDLIITLTGPSGTTITLADRPGVPATAFGCSGDDIDVIFDDFATATATGFENACADAPAIAGFYRPIDPFSLFCGENAAGIWTICVSDNADVSDGQIENFELTIETVSNCSSTLTGTADYSCDAFTPFGLHFLYYGLGDPCTCNGDETYTNGIPNHVGSFNETIYLGTPDGLPVADESATYDFTVVSVTSNPAAIVNIAPTLPVGATLTWDDAADGTPGDGLGYYIVVFDHTSSSGYQVTIDVTLDSDGSLVESLSIGNQCAYPTFALSDDMIEDNICANGSEPDPDDPDVTLILTNTTGGNISLDAVSMNSIDPEGGSLATTFTMITTYDDGNMGVAPNNGADGPAYPSTIGCPVDIDFPITVTENDVCGALASFGLGLGDPCTCNGDETYTNGIPNDVGSFNETFYISTPDELPVADESATYDFTVVSVTSNPAASGSVAPTLPIGATLTWDDAADGTPGDGLGYYIVVFDHTSNSGYQVTIDVTLDLDGSLVESFNIGNQCAYPTFALSDDIIEDNICANGSEPDPDDPDVILTLTNTSGGNISPDAVSMNTIDPEGGSATTTFTMVTTEDDGNSGVAPNNGADGPAYPNTIGCPVDIDLPFTVTENNVCVPSQSIPTLGEWGLIILSLLTLIIGIVNIRQEEKVTA